MSPATTMTDPHVSVARDPAFTFDAFTYLPQRALLLRDGEPVTIGRRALDILECLVEQAGEVVDKRTLAHRAWPTTVVEEVSLRVNLLALRRVLGDGENGARYIVNVPGRGYQFVAPVVRVGAPEDGSPSDASLLVQALGLLSDRSRLQGAIDAVDATQLTGSGAMKALTRLVVTYLAPPEFDGGRSSLQALSTT